MKDLGSNVHSSFNSFSHLILPSLYPASLAGRRGKKPCKINGWEGRCVLHNKKGISFSGRSLYSLWHMDTARRDANKIRESFRVTQLLDEWNSSVRCALMVSNKAGLQLPGATSANAYSCIKKKKEITKKGTWRNKREAKGNVFTRKCCPCEYRGY